MNLSYFSEDLSFWDGDWETGDLIYLPFEKNAWVHTKLSGLVGQNIADQGSSLPSATQVEEFKPGLDLSSELFVDSHRQLFEYDDLSINDWMVEKMDFGLMDMVMNNSAASTLNLDDLDDYPDVDVSCNPKFDLQTGFFGNTELTPPASPESQEIRNEFLSQQFVWKCTDNTHLQKNDPIINHSLSMAPEVNYFSEIDSPNSSFNSENNNSKNNIDIEASEQSCFKLYNSDDSNIEVEVSKPKNNKCKTRIKEKPAKLSNMRSKTNKKDSFKGCKKDRKRSQNRNAATRYRIKKRAEIDDLDQQCEAEELRNKELKTQVSEISREVTYLKELMKELIACKQKK